MSRSPLTETVKWTGLLLHARDVLRAQRPAAAGLTDEDPGDQGNPRDRHQGHESPPPVGRWEGSPAP
jgi:hypothetical protein